MEASMGSNIAEAAIFSLMILMAVSPGIFLLCIADRYWHYIVAISLFIVSMVGFMGIKYTYVANPQVVNKLYNYGEEIK